MKHIFLTGLFLLGTLSILTAQDASTVTPAPTPAATATPAPTAPAVAVNSGFCNIHDLSDSCRKIIKPFMYSSQSALRIALKSEPQTRDISFPAFQGEKYRVVINTLSMPNGTEVDVYDQDPTHNKKAKQLYSTQSLGVSDFDLQSKSNKIFIEYKVPAATAATTTGCSVVVFGFENGKGEN